jgi:hypothetical protein
MFYVLDQSVMRHAMLTTLVQDPATSFVIPDTSLVEMVKSDKWEATMKGSLAILVPAVSRSFVALSVPEALRSERTTRTPVDRPKLLFEEGTKELRELIGAIPTGGAALDDARRRIEALREPLLKEEANAADDKARLEKLVCAVTRNGGPRLVSDLRSQRIGREAQLGLILEIAAALLPGGEPFDPAEAQLMVQSQSFILRYYYLRLRHALWWIARGGLATAKPQTVLNHRLDQEYILIGSFFDKTLTRDSDAADADRDLRALLDASQAAAFAKAYAQYTGAHS